MGKTLQFSADCTTQGDRFASFENIVSRSQTSSLPPPPGCGFLAATSVKHVPVCDELVGPRGEEARHVQEYTQLKRTRAGFKSVLTRERNELSELLESC